jgi:PKD repeat protein
MRCASLLLIIPTSLQHHNTTDTLSQASANYLLFDDHSLSSYSLFNHTAVYPSDITSDITTTTNNQIYTVIIDVAISQITNHQIIYIYITLSSQRLGLISPTTTISFSSISIQQTVASIYSVDL